VENIIASGLAITTETIRQRRKLPMKIIKIDLPRELESAELHIFADEHIGDEHSDLKRIKERIEYVKTTPNAYCILNGDIIDNATKTSIGDTYTQVFNPMEQLAKAVELFEPIKDKILCITHGNHENRTYKKEGINLSRLIADQLGLSDKYTPTSAALFIRVGENSSGRKESKGSGMLRQICYTLYILHGSGGGRKEGAKAIRLADMASIIDTDIYVHSHTHLPMIMKQGYHRVDDRNNAVALVTRLFVNTAANLNYGGYGEAGEFKPSSKDTPVIYLNGKRKQFEARL
jgi:predicted phosphodiesterase